MSAFFSIGGQIPATATNDSAGTGKVGEVVDAASANLTISLTNNTSTNLTSVSLTAGDWDISGIAYFIPAGTTTVTSLIASIGTTSGTVDNTTIGHYAASNYPSTILGNNTQTTHTVPTFRVSISSTTTYYLVAFPVFAASTMTGGGSIHARRVR